eukprot:UN16957
MYICSGYDFFCQRGCRFRYLKSINHLQELDSNLTTSSK